MTTSNASGPDDGNLSDGDPDDADEADDIGEADDVSEADDGLSPGPSQPTATSTVVNPKPTTTSSDAPAPNISTDDAADDAMSDDIGSTGEDTDNDDTGTTEPDGSGGIGDPGQADDPGQEPSEGGTGESGVRVEGRRLIVDGATFQIRGVNWNPVPKGGSHPGDLDYAGFADQDIALMKAAGINAVRTYERLENREVLDKLQGAGIYVFSTVYGWWQDDPSVVTERVNAVKDHPAILAWVLGNEWNYNKLYANDSLSVEQARDQINAAAALIKAIDPDHPVASIYGEVGGIDAMVNAMPDIDLWGINAYRGIDFGDLFSKYAELSDKPLFLGEYGADAYNADIGEYDPESQGEATRVLTQSILDNSIGAGGPASGGFVFEWADEWWKVNGGDLSAQDTGGAAPGGGPYPDGVFNEEFWGIVDIDRNPRPAYDALAALYNE